MALTSSQLLGDMKNIMAGMSIEELQEIIKHANTSIDQRMDQRRKELWGNVIAAIREYEEEIGDIEVRGEISCAISLEADAIDTPGVLYVVY